MIIEMSELFRLEIVQQSNDKRKIRFNDPHEVKMWAKYFNVTPTELLTAFGFYLLRLLKMRVQHSVETQTIDGMKMAYIYRRLSKHYKKKQPKNTDKFWIDTEFLIRSVRVWRDPQYKTKVYFGIPKSIKHPESKLPAYVLFKFLEFGTKRNGKQIIPPRPLIYPHMRFLLARKADYWVYFIKLLIDGKIYFKGSR